MDISEFAGKLRDDIQKKFLVAETLHLELRLTGTESERELALKELSRWVLSKNSPSVENVEAIGLYFGQSLVKTELAEACKTLSDIHQRFPVRL